MKAIDNDFMTPNHKSCWNDRSDDKEYSHKVEKRIWLKLRHNQQNNDARRNYYPYTYGGLS